MKVVFMGTPQFAVVSLNKLLEKKINIAAVVTAPDRQKGRGLKMQPSPVKLAAMQHNIPVLQPEKLSNPDFRENLINLNPDLFVVVAFRILPESIFTIPPLGTVNLHGSILPKYRGAAPINWAIINGEKETGVTTIFINKKVDTGNIIDSRKIEITENMTAGELHDNMAETGAELLYHTCLQIEEGSTEVKKQNEELATNAPKIFKDDCLIDFNQPAEKVHNFIRGLSPYPAAYTYLKGKTVKLFNSRIYEKSNNRLEDPGKIIEIMKDKFVVQCQKSSISISEIQVEGKRKMNIEDYLKGNPLVAGDSLSKSQY